MGVSAKKPLRAPGHRVAYVPESSDTDLENEDERPLDIHTEWRRVRRAFDLVNRVPKNDAQIRTVKRRFKRQRNRLMVRIQGERQRAAVPPPDYSDAAMAYAAQFTDHLALHNYTGALENVPRLVNVVTVRRAPQMSLFSLPMPTLSFF